MHQVSAQRELKYNLVLSTFWKTDFIDPRVNARAMRASLSIFCVFFVLVSSVFASVPPTSQVIAIKSFNQLKVGDSIESLSLLAQERTKWGTSKHVARNYFYLLRSDLPPRCLNLQCGRFARKIMMRDGFLVGGADLKLAKEVGLDFVSTSANQAQSLLIVTDSSGIVTHLYENITKGSLDEILAQMDVR
jgi:hypothetical protein